VTNPFFGVAAAGSTLSTRQTIEIGQLLRPFPQFLNVNMSQSTGAHSQYHAGIVQVRKRVTGWWGGSFSYTYSRLNDNQFGASNYYSSAPGLQNNYAVIPGSPYYDPDVEYGRSLLDSPHKVVIAPTFLLPFGKGKKWADSTLGDALLGNWSITPVIQLQSGFPMGISQNVTGTQFLYGGTLRPNVVRARTSSRRATSRIGSIVRPARRVASLITSTTTRRRSRPRRSTHSAMRRARYPVSCRPGATTSTSASTRRSHWRQHLGVGPARSAEYFQHRPVGGAGELRVRELVVRPNQHAGQQHADGAVHTAVRLLTLERTEG
jgi:hypothetical protein